MESGGEREAGGDLKALLTRKGKAKQIRRKVNLSALLTSWPISIFLSNKWVGSQVFPQELIDELLWGPCRVSELRWGRGK